MSATEIKLKEIMGSVFGIPAASIEETSSTDTIPKWDSVNHIKLVLALEENFQVSFSDEQTVELISFPLVKLVLKEHGIAV